MGSYCGSDPTGRSDHNDLEARMVTVHTQATADDTWRALYGAPFAGDFPVQVNTGLIQVMTQAVRAQGRPDCVWNAGYVDN